MVIIPQQSDWGFSVILLSNCKVIQRVSNTFDWVYHYGVENRGFVSNQLFGKGVIQRLRLTLDVRDWWGGLKPPHVTTLL